VDREKKDREGEREVKTKKGRKERVVGVSYFFPVQHAIGGCFWHLHSMGFIHLLQKERQRQNV